MHRHNWKVILQRFPQSYMFPWSFWFYTEQSSATCVQGFKVGFGPTWTKHARMMNLAMHVLTRYFHHISNRIFPLESPIWKIFLFHFHVAHCLALTENFLGWCIWICTILIILKNCLPWRKHLQRLLKRTCWLHATMYMCTPRLSEPWLSGNSHRPTCTSGVETNLRT